MPSNELLKQLQRQTRTITRLKKRVRQAEAALKAIEKKNEALGNSIPLGIFTIDKQGRVTGANSKMNQLLPWFSVDPTQSKSVFDDSAPLEDSIVSEIRRCFEQQESIVTECSTTNPKGEVAFFRYYLAPVFENDDAVCELIVLVEDISDIKKTAIAIQESENKCRLLFQSAPVAMVERNASRLKIHIDRLRASGVTDLQDFFTKNPKELFTCLRLIETTDYNHAYLKLLEADNIEDVFASLTKGTPDEFMKFALDVVLMVAGGTVWEEREEKLTTVKGNTRSVLGRSLIVSGHEDSMSRVIMTLTDITTLKETQEALRKSEQRYRQQSLRDTLTGLYNRRYLYSTLSQLIETCQKEDRTLSVLFIDLDNFKQIVDTHGHLNGSLTIKEVASTIRECLKEPAFAVSYAGDEFVVVLPDVDTDRAYEIANEIRQRISDTDYLSSQGIRAKLGASFGIATFPDHANDITGLLASSDHALFEAKKSGKSTVRIAQGVSP
jgi:diguanylate cyclase (GGDEF)-like protein